MSRVEGNPPAAEPGERRCGHTDMQGFDVVLECVRPPHEDDLHRTEIAQTWRCSGDLYPPGVSSSGGGRP